MAEKSQYEETDRQTQTDLIEIITYAHTRMVITLYSYVRLHQYLMPASKEYRSTSRSVTSARSDRNAFLEKLEYHTYIRQTGTDDNMLFYTLKQRCIVNETE